MISHDAPFAWGEQVPAGTQGTDSDDHDRAQHICPTGFSRITTEDSCKAAALWVGQGNHGPYTGISASYAGTASYNWVHYGCFWDAYSNIQFNTDTTRSTSSYPLLCEATTTTTASWTDYDTSHTCVLLSKHADLQSCVDQGRCELVAGSSAGGRRLTASSSSFMV
jgi:hypothetical protein